MRGFLPPQDFQTFTKCIASNRASRANVHLRRADMHRSTEPCLFRIGTSLERRVCLDPCGGDGDQHSTSQLVSSFHQTPKHAART